MVKSVIGGFQKISKKDKYYEDDFYQDKLKKKDKVKRKASKFQKDEYQNQTDNTQDFDEENEY